MTPLRVGILGTGGVAQTVHLPVLRDLPSHFHVAALCDISPGTVDAVGDRFGIANRFTDLDAFLAEDLDAVFVLTVEEYHADHVVQALESGRHVLLEKPACLNLAEAETIRAARDASGKHVMVAYMRRYAPAFVEAVEAVKSLGRINFVRVHDIIGLNDYFIEQTTHVLKVNDLPAGAFDELLARREAGLRAALGDVPPEHAGSYRMLLGLGTHDLSAMRELVGMPTRVLSASQRNGGLFQTAHFEFDGFDGTFEMGVDHQRRFDAHIEVFGDTSTVKVQYDTPYIRHLPTTWSIETTTDQGHNRTVHRPTYTDPYTCELLHFHACIVNDTPPKTSIEDAMLDLELCRDIVMAMHR